MHGLRSHPTYLWSKFDFTSNPCCIPPFSLILAYDGTIEPSGSMWWACIQEWAQSDKMKPSYDHFKSEEWRMGFFDGSEKTKNDDVWLCSHHQIGVWSVERMNEPSQKHPVLPWNDPRSSSFSNFCWSRQILWKDSSNQPMGMRTFGTLWWPEGTRNWPDGTRL